MFLFFSLPFLLQCSYYSLKSRLVLRCSEKYYRLTFLEEEKWKGVGGGNYTHTILFYLHPRVIALLQNGIAKILRPLSLSLSHTYTLKCVMARLRHAYDGRFSYFRVLSRFFLLFFVHARFGLYALARSLIADDKRRKRLCTNQ